MTDDVRRDLSPISVNLTRRMYDIITEFGTMLGRWSYDAYTRRWVMGFELYGQVVRMSFVEQEVSWENCRSCTMSPMTRSALKYESTVERMRELCEVGSWEYDLDTMEERETDEYESREALRDMREAA